MSSFGRSNAFLVESPSNQPRGARASSARRGSLEFTPFIGRAFRMLDDGVMTPKDKIKKVEKSSASGRRWRCLQVALPAVETTVALPSVETQSGNPDVVVLDSDTPSSIVLDDGGGDDIQQLAEAFTALDKLYEIKAEVLIWFKNISDKTFLKALDDYETRIALQQSMLERIVDRELNGGAKGEHIQLDEMMKLVDAEFQEKTHLRKR